jgi:very-short-patch-repair endonuclease
MSKKINIGETLMAIHLRELGLDFQTQVKFHATRKWRWDFVVEDNIAIEIDGYHDGRHGAGYGADNEKQNFGTMAGYRVLRFSTQDVSTGRAKAWLAENLK